MCLPLQPRLHRPPRRLESPAALQILLAIDALLPPSASQLPLPNLHAFILIAIVSFYPPASFHPDEYGHRLWVVV